MEKLLDPRHDYSKTEENVRGYLQKLPDSEIESFYEAVEFTPFPLLLKQEYARRFKNKDKTK